jgi:transposase
MTIYCGVDFHTRQQFIKWCDTLDGEIKEERLFHDSLDDVRNFYSQFTGAARIGIEACGYSEWFERMMHDLGHEVWVGDATKIRRRARSRQKTDRRDAELLIDLLLKEEFPRINRLSFKSLEVLRQLRYRHRLVQMRTRMRNSLQAIALSSGIVLKAKLRTKKGRAKLNDLPLSPVLSQQRCGWLEMIEEVERRIAANSRKVTAYVGLEPREFSSGERRRMGRISKAGSRVLRFLLVEAGIKATRADTEMKKLYYRVMQRRERARAKVAVARHLLIHAFIMLRDEIDYAEFKLRGAEMRSNARTVHRLPMPDHLIERPASA